jgi:hypothetical protein
MTEPTNVMLQVDSTRHTVVTAEIRCRVKSNLSRQLLATAQLFASHCDEIAGREGELDWPQPGWEASRSFAIGAVVMAVSALEASINELYLEAVDRNSHALGALTSEQVAQLEVLWESVDRTKILAKYQLVLAVCGKEQFNKGSEPYQSVDALIDLRNAVVHFKPEWDDELEEHAKLETRLTRKFDECMLASRAQGRMVWFPGRCLGAGCANWAVATVERFVGEFCGRLGIRGRFG